MNRDTDDAYEDASDSPVDYSKKYMENDAAAQSPAEGSQVERSSAKEFREREPKVDLFGDYAETDLDQPTDYSLRYAEDDTDEDEKQAREYFPGSVQEDTVKTYCTEGTPYETPFNFSTATSMSDLRVEDLKDNDLLKRAPKKAGMEGHKESPAFKQKLTQSCDQAEGSIGKKLEGKKSAAIINTDHTIPETTVSYYEEGTPAGFSRVNSFSSLNGSIYAHNNVTDAMSKMSLADTNDKGDSGRNESVSRLNSEPAVVTQGNSPSEGKNSARTVDKEGKVVTFCGHDYYAEQTPLMFSRCSSLGSLSGFEQHSIHDDRSSVVSDFSRRTSGIVSPSELPDSPTQTVPPSPRNQKVQPTDFASKVQEESARPPLRRLLYSKSQPPKSSVFEDDIATFKEESTPIEFSTATSLSSLSIDDELKIPDYSKNRNCLPESSHVESDVAKSDGQIKVNVVEAEKDQEQVSDGDEDDEDMLAACISMGMQNNRYRHTFKASTGQKSAAAEPANVLVRYQKNVAANILDSRIPMVPVDVPPASLKSSKPGTDVVPDTVHVYCTEDTPADISPVGSQSNLSALSMPSVQEDAEKVDGDKSLTVECHRNDLSDESSNLSGDDEKILDECIQSGMPKVRQITPPPASCIRFPKKCETVSQKFNVCGTPSSSPVECRHGGKRSAMLAKPVLCRKLIEHESPLSDDSPNHSDDEAILSECIQSAMPKARLAMSPSLRSPVLRAGELPATGTRSSPAFPPFRAEYTDGADGASKKAARFENNFSMSEEEEEIILAQCIRSGIPKALNNPAATTVPTLDRPEKCAKPPLGSTGSAPRFASKSYSTPTASHPRLPCPPADRDLVHQRVSRAPSNPAARYLARASGGESDHHRPAKSCDAGSYEKQTVSGCRARTAHGEVDNRSVREVAREATREPVREAVRDVVREPAREVTREPMSEPVRDVVREPARVVREPGSRELAMARAHVAEEDDDESSRCSSKPALGPSRHSSVSSLSEEGSLGSIEEWALLELCIAPGMRSRCRVQGATKPGEPTLAHDRDDCEVAADDNYSVCSYNSYVCKT